MKEILSEKYRVSLAAFLLAYIITMIDKSVEVSWYFQVALVVEVLLSITDYFYTKKECENSKEEK